MVWVCGKQQRSRWALIRLCFSSGNKNILRHGTDLVVLGGEGFKTGNACSFNAVTEQVTFFIRVLFVRLQVLRTALLVAFKF